MRQVVTNDNIQQLVTQGKVEPFVKPEGSEAALMVGEKPTDGAGAAGTKLQPSTTPGTAGTANDGQQQQGDTRQRGPDGKFLKAGATDEAQAQGQAGTNNPAGETDPDDADLPERVRKQINKKHRAMREAEEFARSEYRDRKAAEDRAARLQTELDQLRGTKSGQATNSGAGDSQAIDAGEEPKQEDFKTVGEYAKAFSRWEIARVAQTGRENMAAYQQQREAEIIKQQFSERIAATMQELPDYAEVVESADIDIKPHVANYIVESELGPRLGYYLAQNPSELERVQKLSPIRAVAELGKIEAKLEAAQAGSSSDGQTPVKPGAQANGKQVPNVSRAPAPVVPLDNRSLSVVAKDPSQMNFQELRAHRENERRERARAARG